MEVASQHAPDAPELVNLALTGVNEIRHRTFIPLISLLRLG